MECSRQGTDLGGARGVDGVATGDEMSIWRRLQDTLRDEKADRGNYVLAGGAVA
jgi:hypothetical protein